jgi:hypothetical protein
MHYKKTFALSGVFLAVAMIVPTVLFSLQAQNDLIVIQNPTGIYTGGNITGSALAQVQASHFNNLIIVLIVELVFLSLFVVTMYFGIRHIHPTHKPD